MNDFEYDRILQIETTEDEREFTQLFHYHPYEPTPYEGLEQLFSHYELSKKDEFVDMGCGKGRVAFYVHNRFDINVTGIEMNPVFFQEALINKTYYTKKEKRKKRTIEFQQVLAQEYDIKPQETVFYFFNPFSLQIFMRVVQKILFSVEQFPRKVTLVLYYPTKDYVYFLENQSVFQLFEEVKINKLYKKNENERFLLFQNLSMDI